MSFLQDLASLETLRQAWQDVAANKGAPGIDRISVEDLTQEIDRHLTRLAEEILEGRHRSLPVLRVRPSERSRRPASTSLGGRPREA